MPVGFLDHTDGGSAFALVAPALAVAWGADLVEKHFTLDRSEKGFDYQSLAQPRGLLPHGRAAAAGRARGAATAPPADSEAARSATTGVMARSIVAGALIPRGEVLSRRDAGLQAHRRALRAGLRRRARRTA